MPKVVITGATGFVGRSLATALLAQGWEVCGVARATAKRPSSLPIDWHTGDVLQPLSLQGAFEGAEYVIHAAGMLGQAGVPEAAYQQLHVEGTLHVLTAVQAQSPQARILYVSSPGVLGPISGAPASEAAPLQPSNPYERSKAAAEELVQTFVAAGMDIVIARPEFIYGPGDAHVLGLFQAVKRGLFFYIGDGQATCHPTYIDDAVGGMVRCLVNGRSGEIYHITGPEPITFRQLGETIAAALDVRPPWLRLPRPLALLAATALEGVGKLTGMTPPLSRTGVAFFSEDRRFSWQKAHNALDYTPQFDLPTGVAATVRWYQEKGWI